jgi:hypothetical protein
MFLHKMAIIDLKRVGFVGISISISSKYNGSELTIRVFLPNVVRFVSNIIGSKPIITGLQSKIMGVEPTFL